MGSNVLPRPAIPPGRIFWPAGLGEGQARAADAAHARHVRMAASAWPGADIRLMPFWLPGKPIQACGGLM